MNKIAEMNIWKKKDNTDNHDAEFQNSSIENLGLTNRPSNCLKRAGCLTIGDLLNIVESEAGLKSVRNLGIKSENEILDKLKEYKESFKGNPVYKSQISNIQIASFKGLLLKPRGTAWYTKIEDYRISASTAEYLHNCGIYYVADLYTGENRKEPVWTAVRELFEAMLLAWQRENQRS